MGDTSTRDWPRALTNKTTTLLKQAKGEEQERDEAGRKATAAMEAAYASLVTGITAGTTQIAAGITGSKLPTGTATLTGCTICKLSAVVSK